MTLAMAISDGDPGRRDLSYRRRRTGHRGRVAGEVGWSGGLIRPKQL